MRGVFSSHMHVKTRPALSTFVDPGTDHEQDACLATNHVRQGREDEGRVALVSLSGCMYALVSLIAVLVSWLTVPCTMPCHAMHQGSIVVFDAAYAPFIRTPGVPKSIFEIEGSRTCCIEVGGYFLPRPAATLSLQQMSAASGKRRGVTVAFSWVFGLVKVG